MDKLLDRGIQNIEDARFVRDHFIPIALQQKRWNIAIYEAERATELLIRGMIRLVGQEPNKETHDIAALVKHLVQYLPATNHNSIPLLITAYAANGDACGVNIAGDRIELFVRNKGINTHLAQLGISHMPELKDPTRLKLTIGREGITLSSGNYVIAQTPAYRIRPPFTVVEKTFIRQPDHVRIRELRAAGERLYKKRNPAYYGEQRYTEQDAVNAISDMNEAFKASEMFFLIS